MPSSSSASASADGAAHSSLLRCPACAAALDYDQRYCVECGARCRTAPRAVAELIASITTAQTPNTGARAVVVTASTANTTEEPRAAEESGSRSSDSYHGESAKLIAGIRLSRPAIATAVMALLAFGVLVGSIISPTQQSAAVSPILVAAAPPGPQASAASTTPATPATEPTAQPSSASEAPTAPAAPSPSPSPSTSNSASSGANSGKQSKPGAGKSRSGASSERPTGPSAPSTSALPPIKHVFLIVLSDQGYAAMFGGGSSATYLSQTLSREGELLPDYYAVTGGELANEIALISGQGPTSQTASNCPTYEPLVPGTAGSEGQTLGSGCVYPSQTQTLADQLTAAHKTWRAYIGGLESAPPGQPTTCRHPALGASDPNQSPTPGDPYVTWRNPFVYFASLTSSRACTENDVGLEQLSGDLASAGRTPSLAYISPSRCQDGSEEPCAPGQPAGLAAADAFLEKVVPEIEFSPAYREGGLIAITSDQAPQSGPNADSSGCCLSSPFPNLPASSSPGSASGSGSTSTSTSTSASTAPGTGTSASGTGTSGTSTSGTGTSTSRTSAAPAGGGKVGLLLISKYVKPGSVNAIGEYNHYALLLSIEDIFGLKPLGYAAAPGLLPFDHSVFNAYTPSSG